MNIKKPLCSIKLFLILVILSLNSTLLSAQKEVESKNLKTSFNQQKDSVVYNDLGFFKKYKNSISFYNNKLEMSFSASHVVQGLANSNTLPDIQLQAEAEFVYKLKPRFDIYAIGKYLSNPINNQGTSQTYMNPLFEQSELGLGIKTEIHDIKLDLGPKLILDSQNLNKGNSFRMSTKLLKKF